MILLTFLFGNNDAVLRRIADHKLQGAGKEQSHGQQHTDKRNVDVEAVERDGGQVPAFTH